MKTNKMEIAMGCGAAAGKTEKSISELRDHVRSLANFAVSVGRKCSLIVSLVEREWDPALLIDEVAQVEIDWVFFESRYYAVGGMLYDISKTDYRFAQDSVTLLGFLRNKLSELREDAFQMAKHFVSDKCRHCSRNEFSDKVREQIAAETSRIGHASSFAVR